MASISLAAYSIRVKDIQANKYCNLDNYSKSKDLLKDLTDYLHNRKQQFYHDQHTKKVLKVAQVIKTDRILTGTIQTGEYGYTSDLMDVDSLTVSHKRKVKEAEMLPFYFLFCLPQDADEGIAIFEKFGTLGIRTIFSNGFESVFNKKNDQYRVQFNHLAPAKIFDAYQRKDGQIKQIRLISYKLPKPIEERFASNGHVEEDIYIEFIIKAKRNRKILAWNSIAEIIKGTNPFDKLVEIPDFESNQIKVEVNVNGKSRTLNLTDQNKIRANYDITKEVKTDANGHPKFASIDELAKGILDEQLIQIGKV